MRAKASWVLSVSLWLASAAAAAGARERVDLIVSGGTVVAMDEQRRVIENGAVAIRGERIVAVGSAAEIERAYRGGKRIGAAGTIVMPGLVNAHNHAPMSLLRGIADDLALMEWLQKYIFPAEARNVSREFVEAGTALACLEMIRSGTTTYCDMYYFEDQVAEVTARAGMRGVLGETIIQFPVADNRTPEEAIVYTEKFIRRWRGHALITPAVAPHAPYTNSAATIKSAKELADRYGVPFIVHVAETRDEVAEMRQKYGTTATAWMEQLGVLGPGVLFNHGVWLTEEDLALVRRRGVAVSHNPESNMKLASGTAPVVRMLALGIPVGLGTDGPASNNNLDMFEAMDFAAKLQKLATSDPTALPAKTVVEMATRIGARAVGLEKEIGSLEAGRRADIILVAARTARGLPMYDVYSHLVYVLKGPDVRTSIINGRVVMQDGKVLTLDEAQVLRKAAEFQKRISLSLAGERK